MKARSIGKGLRVFYGIVPVCAGVAFAALSAYAAENQPPLNKYGVRSWNPYAVEQRWENGKLLEVAIVPSCPPPKDYRGEAVEVPEPDIARGINSISEMPAFTWCYGCSATSAGMMMGHYDRTGYPNMYTGPANGGVCPLNNETYWGHTDYPGTTCGECPLVATHNGIDGRTIRGHVDDYWINYGLTGPDPYVANGWTEHTQGGCTGDYMGTNQWKFSNTDGSTYFTYYTNGDPLYDYPDTGGKRDGCHGMRLFVESRGYYVDSNYYQRIQGAPGTTWPNGFTFANFQSEIDAGYPVLIQLEGHTMLGYGYSTSGNIVYIHDTWDNLDHTMTWGGSYDGMAHTGVTVIHMSGGGPVPPTPTPRPSCPVRVDPDYTSFPAASGEMYIYASTDTLGALCYPFVRVVTPYYGTYYLTAWFVMYPYPMAYTAFPITTGPISGMSLGGIWWRKLIPGTYYIESGAVDAYSFNLIGCVYTVPFTLY